MLAFNLSDFCSQTSEVLAFVGWLLTIVKVAMPLIIIIYGIMDLGKAVVAEKQDEIKTAAKRLLWRAIAGVAIFFIPSIVLWIFGTITDYGEVQGQFETCRTAILYPWQVDNN